MADLVRMKQHSNEKAETYLDRFKWSRLRCKIPIPESEFVKIAQDGLVFSLRKKFEGLQFNDLSELTEKVNRYEKLLEEESNVMPNSNPRNKPFHKPVFYSNWEQEEEEEDECQVNVAEFIGTKPIVCPALQKLNSKASQSLKASVPFRNFTFNIEKASEIFDKLYKANYIKLGKNQEFMEGKEERKYCKWHNANSHYTVDCVVLRNVIQDFIDKGILQFPKKEMQIDNDPFPDNLQCNLVKIKMNPRELKSYTRGKHGLSDKKSQASEARTRGTEGPLSFNPRDADYMFAQLVGEETAKEWAGPGYGRFCMWHQAKSHSTSECLVFINLLQDGFNEGKYVWENGKFTDRSFKAKLHQIMDQETNEVLPKASQALSKGEPSSQGATSMWDGIMKADVVQSAGKKFLAFNFGKPKTEGVKISDFKPGQEKRGRDDSIYVQFSKLCLDCQKRVAPGKMAPWLRLTKETPDEEGWTTVRHRKQFDNAKWSESSPVQEKLAAVEEPESTIAMVAQIGAKMIEEKFNHESPKEGYLADDEASKDEYLSDEELTAADIKALMNEGLKTSTDSAGEDMYDSDEEMRQAMGLAPSDKQPILCSRVQRCKETQP